MGWFMYHAGYIPLWRGDRKSILRCMARARQYLDDEVSVLFFPEGTRSESGVVKEFKPGAFKLAVEAQVDILPLAISGTANALPKHTWKFSDEPTAMRLIVGEVISTKGLSEGDLPQLMAETRDKIVALKEQLDGQPVRAGAKPSRNRVATA
jgi:1-acyl-sn-glycerol-3-phosphate acyltransferase